MKNKNIISGQQILSVPLHLNYNILLWWRHVQGFKDLANVRCSTVHHGTQQHTIFHTTPHHNTVLCGVSPGVVLIGAVILRHCEPLRDVYTAVRTDDASFTALA
jgi:hypothetical protein